MALAPLLSRVRTDATAVKKPDGTTAWTRDALTKALMLKHFDGAPARGVCPVKAGDDRTAVALLDFDSHKGETPWEGMVDAARRVTETAEVFGLHGTAFRSSGGRGVHLVFLWKKPQDAASVRAALTEVLDACGFKNGASGVSRGTVEVFPKQDSVDIDGFGNQFILPFSGKSVPLDATCGFVERSVAWFTGGMWRFSDPVPVIERAAPAAATHSAAVPLALVRAALFAIPNEVDYDGWRDIVFAVHDATGGSPEGLDLVDEWSAQNPIHNAKFLEERVWPYVRQRADGKGKTFKTLAWQARQHGWNEAAHEHLVFEDLTEAEPLSTPQADRAETQSKTSTEIGQADMPRSNVASPRPPRDLPLFARDKQGAPLATVDNVRLAVERDDICGLRVRYDAFCDTLMCAAPYTEAWRAFTDADYVALRCTLEKQQGFAPVGRELIRDVVGAVAAANTFDSAQTWLDGLCWDGVPRIGTFLRDYWGAEDTPYTRSIAAYLWTALAGRVLLPGVKADMVPIAIGTQGAGKSSGIAAMAPAPEFFTEVAFGERDADLARKMRGKVIAEIAELRGLHTREREAILAFITRTHEEWVPKFKEFTTTFPRRLVFFGSTNHTEFLDDSTGYRRWLPFTAGKVDVEGIKRVREQLWAEAAYVFVLDGVRWQDAERLARAEHAQHEIGDSWEATIGAWLDRPGPDGSVEPAQWDYVTTHAVLTEALGFEAKNIRRGDEMRAAAALVRMGYRAAARRREDNGRRVYPFVPTRPILSRP